MSGASEAFLGIIALSLLVMAAVQVGAVLAGLRLVRRMEEMSRQIEHEVKPIIANLTAATNEASRTAALASRQAERLDRLVADVSTRVDETVRVAQHFVSGPARNGLAVLSGVRAAFAALSDMREATRRRRSMRRGVEDEESLFIG